MGKDIEFLDEKTALKAGNACLMCASGRHFLVRILEVTTKTIHTTFPVTDYLAAGMYVDLEFHREDGFLQCRTEVTRSPEKKGDGVLLERPAHSHWNMHRDSHRVATDLMAHVRDAGHPRRYDADLVNLSSGGALIQTAAPFAIPTTIELAFSLPGDPLYTLRARVVHLGHHGHGAREGTRLLGVRFVDLSEEVRDAIRVYISQLLVERHST
ncbi:MAG TPA: PilZ domain-containing protein [Candidatus Hydrogenedentes bacterium]|nr:PilZ domain-containing protein [Candidatus Hydrogenedentota bacterium]HPG67393.1 PilZ domain-containing protein [Candidatus Hydrogenedentota bacterium]